MEQYSRAPDPIPEGDGTDPVVLPLETHQGTEHSSSSTMDVDGRFTYVRSVLSSKVSPLKIVEDVPALTSFLETQTSRSDNLSMKIQVCNTFRVCLELGDESGRSLLVAALLSAKIYKVLHDMITGDGHFPPGVDVSIACLTLAAQLSKADISLKMELFSVISVDCIIDFVRKVPISGDLVDALICLAYHPVALLSRLVVPDLLVVILEALPSLPANLQRTCTAALVEHTLSCQKNKTVAGMFPVCSKLLSLIRNPVQGVHCTCLRYLVSLLTFFWSYTMPVPDYSEILKLLVDARIEISGKYQLLSSMDKVLCSEAALPNACWCFGDLSAIESISLPALPLMASGCASVVTWFEMDAGMSVLANNGHTSSEFHLFCFISEATKGLVVTLDHIGTVNLHLINGNKKISYKVPKPALLNGWHGLVITMSQSRLGSLYLTVHIDGCLELSRKVSFSFPQETVMNVIGELSLLDLDSLHLTKFFGCISSFCVFSTVLDHSAVSSLCSSELRRTVWVKESGSSKNIMPHIQNLSSKDHQNLLLAIDAKAQTNTRSIPCESSFTQLKVSCCRSHVRRSVCNSPWRTFLNCGGVSTILSLWDYLFELGWGAGTRRAGSTTSWNSEQSDVLDVKMSARMLSFIVEWYGITLQNNALNTKLVASSLYYILKRSSLHLAPSMEVLDAVKRLWEEGTRGYPSASEACSIVLMDFSIWRHAEQSVTTSHLNNYLVLVKDGLLLPGVNPMLPLLLSFREIYDGCIESVGTAGDESNLFSAREALIALFRYCLQTSHCKESLGMVVGFVAATRPNVQFVEDIVQLIKGLLKRNELDIIKVSESKFIPVLLQSFSKYPTQVQLTVLSLLEVLVDASELVEFRTLLLEEQVGLSGFLCFLATITFPMAGLGSILKTCSIAVMPGSCTMSYFYLWFILTLLPSWSVDHRLDLVEKLISIITAEDLSSEEEAQSLPAWYIPVCHFLLWKDDGKSEVPPNTMCTAEVADTFQRLHTTLVGTEKSDAGESVKATLLPLLYLEACGHDLIVSLPQTQLIIINSRLQLERVRLSDNSSDAVVVNQASMVLRCVIGIFLFHDLKTLNLKFVESLTMEYQKMLDLIFNIFDKLLIWRHCAEDRNDWKEMVVAAVALSVRYVHSGIPDLVQAGVSRLRLVIQKGDVGPVEMYYALLSCRRVYETSLCETCKAAILPFLVWMTQCCSRRPSVEASFLRLNPQENLDQGSAILNHPDYSDIWRRAEVISSSFRLPNEFVSDVYAIWQDCHNVLWRDVECFIQHKSSCHAQFTHLTASVLDDAKLSWETQCRDWHRRRSECWNSGRDHLQKGSPCMRSLLGKGGFEKTPRGLSLCQNRSGLRSKLVPSYHLTMDAYPVEDNMTKILYRSSIDLDMNLPCPEMVEYLRLEVSHTFSVSSPLTDLIQDYPCMLVTHIDSLPGHFYLYSNGVSFIARETHLVNGSFCIVKPIDSIQCIQMRRYKLRRTALEVFFTDHRSIFLSFPSQELCEDICQKILRLTPVSLSVDRVTSPYKTLKYNSLTSDWVNWKISTFHYLMALNAISGRSIHDLSQYPVFPWVIADYESVVLDLSKPTTFRDLCRPIGAQDPARDENLRIRFSSFEEDPNEVVRRCHYMSHYSNCGSVLHYLVRLEPFTSLHKHINSGRFDLADRLFLSIPATWARIRSGRDVQELVPEFFMLPDFLRNCNNLDIGCTQAGEVVGDVCLPPWAESPEDFVYKNQTALESTYVSENINNWIDLVFGVKQNGPAAEEALNVYQHFAYEGNVKLDNIADPQLRQATELMVADFGQIPCQLFRSPHPLRKSLAEINMDTTDIFKRLPNCQISTLTIQMEGYNSSTGSGDGGSADKVMSFCLCHTRNTLRADTIMALTRSGVLYHQDLVSSCKETMGSSSVLLIWSSQAATKDCTCLPSILDPTLPDHAQLLVASSDGKLVLCAGMLDNSVCQFSGCQIVCRYLHHTDVVTCVDLDQDAQHFVTGSRDSTCAVWKVQSRQNSRGMQSTTPMSVLLGHGTSVITAALHMQLDMCVSGSSESLVLVHAVSTQQLIHKLRLCDGLPRDNVPTSAVQLSIQRAHISDYGRILIHSDASPSGPFLSYIHQFTMNGCQAGVWCSKEQIGQTLLWQRNLVVLTNIFELSVLDIYERFPLPTFVYRFSEPITTISVSPKATEILLWTNLGKVYCIYSDLF